MQQVAVNVFVLVIGERVARHLHAVEIRSNRLASPASGQRQLTAGSVDAESSLIALQSGIQFRREIFARIVAVLVTDLGILGCHENR
jgi:hypothetical protein